MPLSPEKYEKLKAALADPSKEFSDEARERAQAAVDGFKNDFLAKGAAAGEKPLAPGESMRLLSVGQPRAAAPDPDAAKVQALFQQLDPSMPLQPQVLATAPATTHPQGDKAAADEWVRGGLENPAGVDVVYDAPVARVRQKLMENPGLFAALGLSAPTDPEEVARIQTGDVTHQAFNDYEWRQKADDAAKAGRTAYRYSKAPWLGDGKNASILSSLSTKLSKGLQPGMEAARAVVLGYDDTAYLGQGQAGAESSGMGFGGRLPEEDQEALRAKYGTKPPANPIPKPGEDRASGGLTGEGATPLRELNDMNTEDHPVAHTIGQVAGAVPGLVTGAGKLAARGAAALAGRTAETGIALAEGAERGLASLKHWNATDQLWSAIMGKSVPQGAIAGIASSAGRSGAASGLSQVAAEASDAATSYGETGDAGTTLGAAAGRVGAATGLGALMGGAAEAVPSLARGFGDQVRWGKRYRQAPGRLEAMGAQVRPGVGHVEMEGVKRANADAKARGGIDPVDTIAERLAPMLKQVGVKNAYAKVVNASTWRKGQSKALGALEKAAAKAGGEAPQLLKDARAVGPSNTLKDQASLGEGASKQGRLAYGPSALSDAAVLRGVYPVTRQLEGVRLPNASKATVAASALHDGDRKDRRKARDDESSKGYGERAEKAKAAEDAAKPKPKKKRLKRRKENRETP